MAMSSLIQTEVFTTEDTEGTEIKLIAKRKWQFSIADAEVENLQLAFCNSSSVLSVVN
jgi:hypothetical protein